MTIRINVFRVCLEISGTQYELVEFELGSNALDYLESN